MGFIEAIDGLQEFADPRTKDWFLLFGSPFPVWIITLTYIFTVTYVGPKFMENRKPYSLQKFMIIYNLSLVFVSLYLFIEILLSTSAAGYGWSCAPYHHKETWKNPLEMRVATVLWWYSLSKVVEFMDTILMVLRKKQSQVTFLHVYHHASILNVWWIVESFLPGGQAWFSACLNCLVHVVMYAYYGLSLIPSLRDKLWWKKYITKFQLVQFVTILYHTVQTHTSGCDFPGWGVVMLTGYMISMLILFGNFYYQAYRVKRRSTHAKKTDASKEELKDGAAKQNGYQNGVTYANIGVVSNGQSLESNGVKQRH